MEAPDVALPVFALRMRIGGALVACSLLLAATRAHAQSNAQEPARTPQNASFDLARDARPRTRALWLLPAWITAIGPLLNHYGFGLGANLPLTRSIELSVALGIDLGSYVPGGGTFGPRVNYTAYTANVGVAFFLYRPRPLNGFFLQPTLFAAGYTSQANAGNGPGVNVGAALELGYQLTAGPVYFTPVVGFGLGVGVGTERAERADRTVGWNYFAPGVGPFPAANIAALRLGLAF